MVSYFKKPMTDKFIIANWKSNKNLEEALNWVDEIKPHFKNSNTVVLCPPFPFLESLQEKINEDNLPIRLGVQNLSPFPAGAYTGEVSTRNLEDLGVKYAILGHSERRKYVHESNQDVANKVSLAIAAGIVPIVCVDKDNVLAQSNAIEDKERGTCIVAYEPEGHIGTGEVDSIEDVLATAKDIRLAFGSSVKVLYGGSTAPETAMVFLEHAEVNGLLVGGSSLDAKTFGNML